MPDGFPSAGGGNGGLLANRPAAAAKWSTYYATDVPALYEWTGSAWATILGSGGTVTSVAATDTSIVVAGTAAAPTIATGTLDVIAAQHPPVAAVALNAQKITGLANGTAATDAATFGQIPATPAALGALAVASNLSDVASAATSRTNLGVLPAPTTTAGQPISPGTQSTTTSKFYGFAAVGAAPFVFTPTRTGRVKLWVSGVLAMSAGLTNDFNFQLFAGTGAVPAAGTATAGYGWAACSPATVVQLVAAGVGNGLPFAICCLLTGLALGTAVGCDLGVFSSSASPALSVLSFSWMASED